MLKHFSKILVLAGIFATSLTSCKKDEVRTTAEFSAEPTFKASTANAGVLLKADKNTPAVVYTWTPYTFTLSDGTTAASLVTYTLQLAKAGTNFATPYELSISADNNSLLTLTVGQLNAALINLRAPLMQVTQLEARLKTFSAKNEPFIYSNVLPISATPYDECVAPNSDVWSLIGPAGTDWNTDIALTWSCVENAYVLTQPLNAAEFKFRRNSDWGVNLGGAGSAVAPLSVGVATPLTTGNPPNLKIATAGTYTIKLKVTGSGATTAGTVTVTQ